MILQISELFPESSLKEENNRSQEVLETEDYLLTMMQYRLIILYESPVHRKRKTNLNGISKQDNTPR